MDVGDIKLSSNSAVRIARNTAPTLESALADIEGSEREGKKDEWFFRSAMEHAVYCDEIEDTGDLGLSSTSFFVIE